MPTERLRTRSPNGSRRRGSGAGPIGLAVRALSDADRQAVTAQCEAALEPFVVETGYEVPCVALRAVAK